MRIARKYSLNKLGHLYETIEIEEQGEKVEDVIKKIDEAWQTYRRALETGWVE